MGKIVVADRLRISVLGPLELRVAERLVTVAARKDRALLAVVALAPGRVASRARLAELLWGESAEARARDSLKQSLIRLRRLFAAESIEALIVDRRTVALAPGVAIDATDLMAGGDDLAARRGPLLDGLEITEQGYHDWLVSERARLDAAFLDHGLTLMRRAEASGRAARAAELARQILAADRLAEEAERCLMRVHLGRGERRLALQRFEAFRTHLMADLGVEPEPETLDLARRCQGGAPDAPREPPAIAAGTTTVAVLPFAMLDGDTTQDYFADGLTEDIITDLAKVEGIEVVARSTAFALKGRCIAPVDAARSLGASHVVEGSVRREGGRVRVTARLIDGASGRQLWADRYDRPLAGVFAVQDEISRSILDVLPEILLRDVLPSSRGTRNVEAYELYLKARSLYLRGLDAHSLNAARMLLTRALEQDGGYAEAYALLAICEFYLAVRQTPASGVIYAERCLSLGRRASTLDPALAEAHAATGLAHYAAGDYEKAEQELEAAIRLDPDLFEAQLFLARNRRLQGDRRAAAHHFARAAALRQDDYRSMGLLAEELTALQRCAEAEEAFVQTVERLERAIDRHPDNSDALAFGASVLAEFGRTDQAHEWVRWAQAFGQTEGLVQYNYNLARALTALDRRDEAAAYLETVFRTDPVVRRRIIRWMEYDPIMAHLVKTPDTARLLDGISPA